jgi:HEAT repeat protein
MRERLSQLIDRMAIVEATVNSAVSVSWHAYREAEQLTDCTMISELAEYLLHEKDKQRRTAAYFILRKLGVYCDDADCARLLVERLGIETDKHVLAAVLEALREVPKAPRLDLAPVFSLLGEPRWLVRHAAIRALKDACSGGAEDAVLELLQRTSDKFDITYCLETLVSIGSPKAIPVIQPFLQSRVRNIKAVAFNAIDEIEWRAEAVT